MQHIATADTAPTDVQQSVHQAATLAIAAAPVNGSVAIESVDIAAKQVAATATLVDQESALVFLPYTSLAEAQALMAGDEAAQQQAVEAHMLKTHALAQHYPSVCDTGALTQTSV
jgi:hypothetical protein